MKDFLRIFFFFSLLSFLAQSASADEEYADTNAIVSIRSAFISADSLQFEVLVRRIDNRWTNFINSTFQITLNDPSADFSNIAVSKHPDTQGIPFLDPLSSSYNKYIVKEEIVSNSKISITILGPDGFPESQLVPLGKDTSITVARYYLYTKNGADLPYGPQDKGLRFSWVKPLRYYQAFAFKLENALDSLSVQNYYNPDDNVEISSPSAYGFVNFLDDDSPRPEFELEYFDAIYVGNRNVRLIWKTKQEANNAGFIIRRGLLPFTETDPSKVVFDTPTASFENGGYQEIAMTGLGTRVPGKEYSFEFDTVTYRGARYCYQLYRKSFSGIVDSVAIACVLVPNAVITYAQANPNPFPGNTQVEFTVDDDVILTAKIFDLKGKEVQTLYENQVMKMGSYTFDINMPFSSMNGLYDLVFIAKPINDASVDFSQAVVKLQLIK